MYYKNIEEGKNKDSKRSFGRTLKASVPLTKEAKLIAKIRAYANGCNLVIDEDVLPLKKLSEQELKIIENRLADIINYQLKGMAAGVYFGKLMQFDAAGIDKGFYLKMSAKDLYENNEKEKKAREDVKNELELLKRQNIENNNTLNNIIKNLKDELLDTRSKRDELRQERDKLSAGLNNFELVNKSLAPFVRVSKKYGNNGEILFEADRKYLDDKIKEYDEQILAKQKLLNELEVKIKTQYKTEIINYLEQVDKYLDKNQKVINGEFFIDDEYIKAITEFLKKVINKKMTIILDLNEKINKSNEELILQKDNLDKFGKKIEQFQMDMQELSKTKLSIENRFNIYRAKVNRILIQIKEKCAEYGIIMDIDPKAEGNELIWNDKHFSEQKNELIKKIEEKKTENEKLFEEYNKARKEKEILEIKQSKSTEELYKLNLAQTAMTQEIDSVYDQILKCEKDMSRTQLELIMKKVDYANSFKTENVKGLANHLKELLLNQVVLNEEMANLKSKIRDYEQLLISQGTIITKSLLMIHYAKTANIFERLTAKQYNFSSEASQLLAIYLCAAADKQTDKTIRAKIFEFLGDKPSKTTHFLNKWLEQMVYEGAFKIEPAFGEKRLKITCTDKPAGFTLLPEEDWQRLINGSNESLVSIVFREIFPLLGINYKNNENNRLVEKIENILLINFNRRFDEVNDQLQIILNDLITENNILKKYELLDKWWRKNQLNTVARVSKDFDNKKIFINFNSKFGDGFKEIINDNNNLFEVFMDKYSLKYSYLIKYLPKQYLFYSDDFLKLLEESTSRSFNNNAKAIFYKIFNENIFNENNAILNVSDSNNISKSISLGYLLLSSLAMVFMVWPTIFLQFSLWSSIIAGILATIPVYLLGIYSVFRYTGLIKLSWFERQERKFFLKLYTEFINTINEINDSKKIVLSFQKQIPIMLLENRDKYIVCMKGLLEYFLPRTQRNLLSLKFMQNNWPDIVSSLMHGQLHGVLGAMLLNTEQLNKISELMSMLVVLDILINKHNKPFVGLITKIQRYYGLRGN